MRILHLAWEYPPLVYGGIAPHVANLAAAQAADGHEVAVLTQAHPQAPADSICEGVRVVRVAHHPPHLAFAEDTLLAWVATLNSAMSAALVRMPGPEMVHAHDWVTAWSAATARDGLGLPLVATFHSTERGRHQGHLPSQLSRSVNELEAWLAAMATEIITCSASMAQEVSDQFAVLPTVIPNGVRAAEWSVPRSPERYPLIVFAGRLEWEKGIFDLVDAMPALRRRIPGIRLIMAGRGSQEAALRERIRGLRLGRAVTQAGHVTQEDLAGLFARAHAVAVPSRYEPFGIVALEAAAASAPLVLARTGGLVEIGREAAAMMFDPGDVAGLTTALHETINDASAARTRASVARTATENLFAWPTIAKRTTATYSRAFTASG